MITNSLTMRSSFIEFFLISIVRLLVLVVIHYDITLYLNIIGKRLEAVKIASIVDGK